MILTTEIKNIKYNYKPNVITLKVSKILNSTVNVDLIYSTENQYILDSKDIDNNIVGEKKEYNIITCKESIKEHIINTYKTLQTLTDDHNMFEEFCKKTDWMSLYICSLLDLDHVLDITFYFYKKYAFVKIDFNDGNFETFIHLNIFFNQDTDMSELKKDLEPFQQDEINYIQSSDFKNCEMITKMFTNEFSIFPFEEVYENILKQNEEKNKEDDTNE